MSNFNSLKDSLWLSVCNTDEERAETIVEDLSWDCPSASEWRDNPIVKKYLNHLLKSDIKLDDFAINRFLEKFAEQEEQYKQMLEIELIFKKNKINLLKAILNK